MEIVKALQFRDRLFVIIDAQISVTVVEGAVSGSFSDNE